jgi:hypothetical protein
MDILYISVLMYFVPKMKGTSDYKINSVHTTKSTTLIFAYKSEDSHPEKHIAFVLYTHTKHIVKLYYMRILFQFILFIFIFLLYIA